LWHKISAGFNGSLTFSASGGGIIPINDAVIALTDDGSYHEYVSGNMTPTSSGYITMALKARDGVVTGNVFIDDVTTE
jgi:hypothetical protein